MEIEYGSPIAVEEVKSAGDAWEVSGYASTFGNVDLGNDVVVKGAFDEWLSGWKSGQADFKTRFLFSHQPAMILGKPLSMAADDKGLLVRAKISKTQLGADVHTLLKDGALDSFSIGYVPTGVKMDPEAGLRMLTKIELPEFSLVAMPMNSQAIVNGVKHDQAQVQSVKHTHCATCMALIEKSSNEEEPTKDAYVDMTLVQLASATNEVVAAFGERTRDLLEKLQAGDFSLTEAKRTDLQALLETFSGIDAVRHDAEAVLAQKHQEPDPKPSQISQTALALELYRHRLRARGVEV